jgi:glutaredoxin-like protein
MGLLKEEDRKYLQDEFARKLADPVRIAFFTQKLECQYCQPTEELLSEVSALSDKITLEKHHLLDEKQLADQLGVDKIPGIALIGRKDYGVRFFGIPSGFEFGSLIEGLVDVSRGTTGLTPDSREKLKGIAKPVRIQVFVTPTCPYCQSAVRLAHQAAIESDMVTAHMVESVEFPHLAQRYGVMGVPKVVINETIQFEGAQPEPVFINHVLRAAE